MIGTVLCTAENSGDLVVSTKFHEEHAVSVLHLPTRTAKRLVKREQVSKRVASYSAPCYPDMVRLCEMISTLSLLS
jgi:hypothetical protein